MRWVRLHAYQIKPNQKLVLGVGGNHKYLGKIFSDQHTGQTNSKPTKWIQVQNTELRDKLERDESFYTTTPTLCQCPKVI